MLHHSATFYLLLLASTHNQTSSWRIHCINGGGMKGMHTHHKTNDQKKGNYTIDLCPAIRSLGTELGRITTKAAIIARGFMLTDRWCALRCVARPQPVWCSQQRRGWPTTICTAAARRVPPRRAVKS